ncbi:MAG: ribonuclease H-like domain-containing protein [Deltaproteobacteria bacterium]|nr:ribonuclease H-like domain-containing protein [Deltaproteobacteria bacterium]
MDEVQILFEIHDKKKAYLDIETDFSGHICVIGIARENEQFVQFYGEDVITQNIERILVTQDVIVTFNGERFDLPVIKKQLNLDLKESHLTVDLYILKKKIGIKGGLKEIEKLFGIKRNTTDLTGYDACRLWERYIRYGDRGALDLLLEYNKEDVINLIQVENLLRSLLRGKYDRGIRNPVKL